MDRNYERIAMKLQAVEGRYEELGVQLTLPEVTADSARLQRLMREHSELGELAEFARGYRLLMDDAEEAQQMADSDDEGMRELGREELATLEPELEKRTQEARIRTITATPCLRYARARAATRPVCSARSCCACTSTMPTRRAGSAS